MSASATPALSRAQLMAVMPPQERRAELLIVTFVISVFVLLCLLGAATFAWQEWRWRVEAVPQQAEVLRINYGSSRRPDTFMARYVAAGGRGQEAAVSFADGQPPEPGDRLTILVRPGVPYLGRTPGTGLDWAWLIPAGMAALLVGVLAFQWRPYRAEAERFHRLRKQGHRYPAHTLRTEAVSWGGKSRRYGIVATWTDANGRERLACAGPFAYDPAALLDERTELTVLVDPFDPTQAMVAPEGLPPRSPLSLTRAQSDRLLAAARN